MKSLKTYYTNEIGLILHSSCSSICSSKCVINLPLCAEFLGCAISCMTHFIVKDMPHVGPRRSSMLIWDSNYGDFIPHNDNTRMYQCKFLVRTDITFIEKME
ncbi:hypothetical protein L2E82_26319 [Cichorium intybus]|uniref:Uncharacterized protein n=1 Tax=Cichorium intybus TaxID=13427 RepID=A0ACB9CR20_CICIN|nr:hypothetical protein L2E82_26319 [Cichorium intybus]